MESKLSDKSFELSVLGALIIMICCFVIEFIVYIPFGILSETMYINSHKYLELIVAILKDLTPKIVMTIVLLKIIRENYKPNFNIKYIEKFNFKMLLCTVFLMLGLFLWLQSSMGIIVEKIPMPESFEKIFEEMAKNPYVMVISLIIIAPIFEEILMRGSYFRGIFK